MDPNINDVSQSQGTNTSVEEKYVPQTKVNEIIGAVKNEERERGRLEGRLEAMKELHNKEVPINHAPVNSTIDSNKVSEMVDSALSKRQKDFEIAQQEAAVQNLHNTYEQKVGAAKASNPDFAKKVEPIESELKTNFPYAYMLATADENTADILNEFAENPYKMAQLEDIGRKSIALAQSQMGKLSQSIRQNKEAAQQQKNVREPLGQVKHSNVGLGNGDLDLDDYRNQSYTQF